MRRVRSEYFAIGIGWYMAMSYPQDGSLISLIASLVAGTAGVGLVGMACYSLGRDP